MSYVIHFDKWSNIEEEYRNVTWEEVSSSDRAMASTEGFEWWLDENYSDYDLDIEEIKEGWSSNEDVDATDLIEEFRGSEDFYSIQDAYTPIYNYVHVLQHEPTWKEVLLVDRYVGNVVVIEIEACDMFALALTGCGMDLSDNIELAYYLTDGQSPVKASQIMSLSKKAESMLLHFRKYAKEYGRVSPNEVANFIKEYDDGEKKSVEKEES